MKISQTGIDLIKRFEGCRLKSYKCSAGVLTIGYGHTNNVKQGMCITQQQAEDLLLDDLKIYESYVNKLNRKFNQNQFDALVSFTFNCGPGCLYTLVKNRDNKQITDAILLYNKSNNKIVPGLVNRRKAERELFIKAV